MAVKTTVTNGLSQFTQFQKASNVFMVTDATVQ